MLAEQLLVELVYLKLTTYNKWNDDDHWKRTLLIFFYFLPTSTTLNLSFFSFAYSAFIQSCSTLQFFRTSHFSAQKRLVMIFRGITAMTSFVMNSIDDAIFSRFLLLSQTTWTITCLGKHVMVKAYSDDVTTLSAIPKLRSHSFDFITFKKECGILRYFVSTLGENVTGFCVSLFIFFLPVVVEIKTLQKHKSIV